MGICSLVHCQGKSDSVKTGKNVIYKWFIKMKYGCMWFSGSNVL